MSYESICLGICMDMDYYFRCGVNNNYSNNEFKKMIKYRFTILYQNKNMRIASDFMKNCDMNIGEICTEETYELTAEKERDVGFLKILLQQAFEYAECKILKIEGGKYE